MEDSSDKFYKPVAKLGLKIMGVDSMEVLKILEQQIKSLIRLQVDRPDSDYRSGKLDAYGQVFDLVVRAGWASDVEPEEEI